MNVLLPKVLFRKKKRVEHYFYSFLGVFVLLVEVVLYIFSMKVLLLDVIPIRLVDSYLDFPATCLVLFGYLLTFRSLALAWFTDSETSSASLQNSLSIEEREAALLLKSQQQGLHKEVSTLLKRRKVLDKLLKRKRGYCQRRKTFEELQAKQKAEFISIAEQLNDLQVLGKIKEAVDHDVDDHDCHSSDTPCTDHTQKISSKDVNGLPAMIKYLPVPLNKESRRACITCNQWKETDDHHCSMCNKCVFRMDHHCFFVGQCVGDNNYAFFLSYVFLSYVMTLVNLFAIIPDLLAAVAFEWNELSTSLFELIIMLLAGGLFHFFTMVLMVQHFYYISNEITYLENRHGLKHNNFTPLQWICVILKGQVKAKFGDVFAARWLQIFHTHSPLALIFPERYPQNTHAGDDNHNSKLRQKVKVN